MIEKTFQLEFRRKWYLNADVLELEFIADHDFTFRAGQYLEVAFGAKESDSVPSFTPFSIASEPGGPIHFCVRITPRNSAFLDALNVGDRILARGPRGRMMFSPLKKNACFVATGTGIAPIRSILRSKELLQFSPQSVTLLYGARDSEEFHYVEELRALPWLELSLIASDPGEGWSSLRGRVTDFLETAVEGRWLETDFYLSGQMQMVQDATLILLEREVSRDSIFSDFNLPPLMTTPLLAKV